MGGYGAASARLTPDQKVGSSNLSGLSAAARAVLSLMRPAPLGRADQSGESRCAGIPCRVMPVMPLTGPQLSATSVTAAGPANQGGQRRAGPALPGVRRICGTRVGRRVCAQA